MALTPTDLLRPVVAVDAPALGRLYRLAIDDAGGRFRFAPGEHSQALAQDGVNPLPQPGFTPRPLVVIDGLPLRELVRQEPPSAAASQEVKDRVADLAHIR